MLRLLARAGIVSSRRGPTGGFYLQRPPESITLLEVIRAVDPFERIRVCPLGLPRLVDHDIIDHLNAREPDDKDSPQAQP
ncbi:MAG: Rrf2 family transcriptional regulator [Planctomycetes bacterium]|nr:Rrf2 family transcriptional regulator [Planctomycetota bacterium]